MGILQARILEWVAMSSSRRSSQPRDQTQVSCIIVSATREAIQGLQNNYKMYIIHVWENQKQKKERNRKKYLKQ